jgi:RHS repeat-associated protein
VKKLYNPGVSVTDDKGNKFFYLHNGHGDVANLIDKDGNIVDAYSYDAFGKTIGVSKNANGSRYVGAANVFSDGDVGLQYMWNRWYDPELGRFISRDPIGFAGGLNLYGYVYNNPLTFVDPFGLDVYSIGVNISVQIGPVTGSFGAGFAVDTSGNVGTYSYGGGGGGAGAKLSGSFEATGSNSNTISDFAGPFNNAGGSLGAGLNGSLGVFTGTNNDGSPILGSSVGLGVGAGGGASVTRTYTKVDILGKIGNFGSGGKKNGCP